MYVNHQLSTVEIAKKLNCTSSSVWRVLNKNGIDTSKKLYNFDDTFFNKIDNEEKAYVLGLFYTDGNNIKNTVRISMCDKDIIEKIKIAMKAEQPIYEKPPTGTNRQTQYELRITRKGFSDKLTALGCPPNKTFLLKFPGEDILPKDLQRHFIRGALDGDGSITNGSLFFTGTISFMKGIEDVVYDNLGFKFCWYHRYPEKGEEYPIRTIGTGQVENIIKMIEYMYVDAKIYGDRKYHKSMQYLGRKSK